MYFEHITKRGGSGGTRWTLSDRKHVESSRSYVITVFASGPPGKNERLVSVLITVYSRKMKLIRQNKSTAPAIT